MRQHAHEKVRHTEQANTSVNTCNEKRNQSSPRLQTIKQKAKIAKEWSQVPLKSCQKGRPPSSQQKPENSSIKRNMVPIHEIHCKIANRHQSIIHYFMQLVNFIHLLECQGVVLCIVKRKRSQATQPKCQTP